MLILMYIGTSYIVLQLNFRIPVNRILQEAFIFIQF